VALANGVAPMPTADTPRRAIASNRPIVEVLTIALPTIATMASYTLMQFADAIMVSRIGPDPAYVAAQGNGGMVVWLAMSFVVGLTGVINTYVAQHMGAGSPRKAGAYGWVGIWMSLAAAVLVIPYVFAMGEVFAMLDHPPRQIAMETSYAKILAYGAFFTMGARAISQFFFGLHRPGIVLISAIAGNTVNVVANAVLIYGSDGPGGGLPLGEQAAWLATTLGAPALGVDGAAWGTVIGSAVELAVPTAIFLSPAVSRAYGTRAAWLPRWGAFRDVWRIGWPGGLMTINEMICWGYLMIVLLAAAGRAAGDDPELHNAVGWIGLRYMHMAFMPAIGISFAVTAVVGRHMGRGDPDAAARRAWIGLAMSVGWMAFCGLVFVVFREPLIFAFTEEDAPAAQVDRMLAIGSGVLIAAAFFQVFDAIGITMSGALRGAGDTVWPGVVTVVLSWTCVVGVGHLLVAFAPGLGSIGPWIGAALYFTALGIVLLGRFVQGRWRSIRLVQEPAEDPFGVPSDGLTATSPGQV